MGRGTQSKKEEVRNPAPYTLSSQVKVEPEEDRKPETKIRVFSSVNLDTQASQTKRERGVLNLDTQASQAKRERKEIAGLSQAKHENVPFVESSGTQAKKEERPENIKVKIEAANAGPTEAAAVQERKMHPTGVWLGSLGHGSESSKRKAEFV